MHQLVGELDQVAPSLLLGLVQRQTVEFLPC